MLKGRSNGSISISISSTSTSNTPCRGLSLCLCSKSFALLQSAQWAKRTGTGTGAGTGGMSFSCVLKYQPKTCTHMHIRTYIQGYAIPERLCVHDYWLRSFVWRRLYDLVHPAPSTACSTVATKRFGRGHDEVHDLLVSISGNVCHF